MNDTVGVALESGIVHQLRSANLVAKPLVLPVVAHRYENALGLGAELVVGAYVGMLVAGALRRVTGQEPVGGVGMQQRHRAVVEGDFNELAAARTVPLLQRQQDSDGGIHAG